MNFVQCSFGALGWFIVTRRENEASGDDIAWLRFGDDGRLYAINPEAGFFGIAPGLSKRTNPVAMAMLRKNCIFTNVAETANGEFFWQGLENEIRARFLSSENRKWFCWQSGLIFQS